MAGRMKTLKALYRNPVGKAVAFMGLFTVVLLSHRWYIRPFFQRRSLKESEEMAEHVYQRGQMGSRADQRH